MRINLWSTLAGAVALTLVAVTSDIGRAADVPPPGESACAALATAQFATVATLTTTYEAGSAAQPAHCVVRGAAARRTGADGKPYQTRFELRLPTAWSGRFLYQGGGGNDGVVAPAVGRNTGSFPDTGLQRGFSVVTTDAGHQGGTAEFGIDPVARVDHAYAAHERTYTIAMAIQSQYLRPRTRPQILRRLLGRRTAGHDVRAALSRVLRRHRHLRAGDERVERRDDRRGLGHADVPRPPLRPTRTVSACSAARSATPTSRSSRAASPARATPPTARTDGMVLRPDACRFDPNTLLCRGEKDANCLTATQVAALQRAFGGPRTSSGRALYVGQAWDPGIAAPGWRQWKLGSSQTATPNAANTTLMAGALAYEFVTPPDPSLAITRVRFRSRSRPDAGVLAGVRHLPRRDARRVPQARREAADLPRHGRSDLLGARVDRLLPAAHAQQRRARAPRRTGPVCSWCPA